MPNKKSRGKHLVPKQEVFVEHMARPGMTQQTAAKLAGYTRSTEATRLINNPKIYNRIEKRKTLAAEFSNITPEAILGATALRAFASIDDAFNEHGEFDIAKARRTGAIHLIKKLEKTQFGYKVEFYDADKAQEKLGNYLGLDKAPTVNHDVASLKLAIAEVALHLADGGEVTLEHRRQATFEVARWVKEKRARYSIQALQEIQKEFIDE